MKTIVTHISVDLEAVTSTWLVKRYMPGFAGAEVKHVSAGKTLNDMKPDEDPDIVHVDTGMGQFDHHQLSDPEKRFSATRRVFDHLKAQGNLKQHEVPALEAMVSHVTSIDHFGELYFPEPQHIRYNFGLDQIFDGFKANRMEDAETLEIGFKSLDAILLIVRQKINAEDDIKKGYIFDTKWGKAIAMDTKNEEAVKQALKAGYKLVIRRNPDYGHIRIKSWPVTDIDLTPVHDAIVKKDPKATWYLHSSKNMLLNGSNKRPDSVASSLALPQVIEIIRSIT
jgi:hypothetical protein